MYLMVLLPLFFLLGLSIFHLIMAGSYPVEYCASSHTLLTCRIFLGTRRGITCALCCVISQLFVSAAGTRTLRFGLMVTGSFQWRIICCVSKKIWKWHKGIIKFLRVCCRWPLPLVARKILNCSRKYAVFIWAFLTAVSYTHLTLPTSLAECRSRWSPYH